MTITPDETLREIVALGTKATPGPLVFAISPGGELTGVEAEIAEMQDCEPFAYSQATALNGCLTLVWDSREEGATEKAVALVGFLTLARQADTIARELLAARAEIERMQAVVDAAREALREARRYLQPAVGETEERLCARIDALLVEPQPKEPTT